jgi:hypothetical protein
MSTILGAGAYLAPRGSTKAFYFHAGNSSTSEQWETPHDLLEQLYSVFGIFDLDSCWLSDSIGATMEHMRYFL